MSFKYKSLISSIDSPNFSLEQLLSDKLFTLNNHLSASNPALSLNYEPAYYHWK